MWTFSKNTINNNTARHNGSEWEGGYYIDGDGNTLSGNLAEYNPGYGFYIDGDNTLTGNTAHGNYRTGIYLGSTGGGTLSLATSTVTGNQGEGIANFAGATGTVNIGVIRRQNGDEELQRVVLVRCPDVVASHPLR